jgi:ADP-ribosylglycohydrolase
MKSQAGSAERILGCLLGGALGDAIGSAVEGQPPPVELPPPERWSLTDDTQLSLATCEALLAKPVNMPEAIAVKFAAWHTSRRFRGLGASTLKALEELVVGGHWALVGRSGEQAAGNGAAMRVAPLAFCLTVESDDDRRTLRDAARITHRHDEAYVGALAIVAAIRFAWLAEEYDAVELVRYVRSVLPDSLVRDKLDKVIDSNSESVREIAAITGTSGYVAESVPLAVAAGARVSQLGFETMIPELIGVGGDTDTIASMAGQIAGSTLGATNLPAQWLNHLPERKLINGIALPFSRAFARTMEP